MNQNNNPMMQPSCEGQISAPRSQSSLNSGFKREDLEEALCRTTAELEGYRALYDSTPLIYFILDLNGKVLSLNRYGAMRLGYAVAELVEQPMFATFHPDDRTALNTAFLNFVHHSLPSNPHWEFRQVCRDGSLLWVKITVRILNSIGTAPIALFVCEDITVRRQAESRLHLLEQAIEGASNSIVIADATQPDFPILYVNPSFEQVTGYSAAEAIGRNCRFLQGTDIDQPALAELRSALYEGRACRVMLRNYRKDGSLFWNELHIAPMYGPGGQLTSFVGVQNDVTEAKRNEEALRQQAEREHWIAAMTKLSAGIAQRIRRSLDLKEILDTTVNEVRQFLNVDRVVIYRFQPDWSGVVAVESVGSGWRSILGMTIKDSFFDSPTGRNLYQQGRIQAVDDIDTAGLSKCHEDLLKRLQIRANLVVPILQQSAVTAADANCKEQLWGLLVAHQCADARQWQPLETDLLWQLATQVGIAIQQAELYQQVQRLNAELEQQVRDRTTQLQQALDFEAMLKRITDKVRDTLDERQILQTAVRELSLGLGVDRCDTALYDLEQNTATISYEHSTAGMPISEGRLVHMSHYPGIYSQVLQGACFQFCKRCTDQHWLVALVCPIFDDQGTLGDLWLFKPKDKLFNDLEIRLVQQVANQCAIAIRQARLHEAAHAQLKAMEKLNQLKDDFLSTVSHELRSPVCNMKMAIQMLEVATRQEPLVQPAVEQTMSGQHRFSRYLQILNSECDREINLINDLLDLQRLESKLQPFSPGAIELPLWLAQLIRPFQERAHQRHQRLQLLLPPQLPILVSDPSHLERILAELLNNACKYTPPGEQIVVTARAEAQVMQIEVCNSGVEIPLEEQARIFDKFYRISSADRWGQGGTGLGLALVKKLTELSNGRVWVESGSGQTAFIVELLLDRPLKEREAAAENNCSA